MAPTFSHVWPRSDKITPVLCLVDDDSMFVVIIRGPPEDIIHYFTLMSSKLTFYIIFENWTFYINVFNIDIILHYF